MHTRSSAVVRRRTAAPIAALGLALAATTACGGGDRAAGPNNTGGGNSPPPAAATVTATATSAFSPRSVSISPGGKVTFRFESVTHNVTFSTAGGAPANIGDTSNSSVDRAFPTAGSFAYHCTIHPTMTGTVVVAATSSSTT